MMDEGAGAGGGGGGGGGCGCQTALAKEVCGTSLKAVIAACGCVLCLGGQFVLWVKLPVIDGAGGGFLHWWIGTYSLYLVMVAFLNLVAEALRKPWIHWVSALLMIVSIDTAICTCDWAFEKKFGDPDDLDAVKAGFILTIIGVFVTFIVFPVTQCDTSTPTIVGIVFCVLVCIGNVLLWVKSVDNTSVCSWQASINPGRVDGGKAFLLSYPLYFGRAFWIGMLHLASLVGNYSEGRTLGFILAAVTVSDYQPGGLERYGDEMKLRCSEDWATCNAGVFTVFFGMWGIIIHYLIFVVSVHKSRPAAEKLTKEKKGWLMIVLFVMAGVGGALIWAPKSHGRHVCHAQEAWDVVVMVLCALLMLLCHATGNESLAMLALALALSVINRIISAGSFNGRAGPNRGRFDWAAAVRAGVWQQGGWAQGKPLGTCPMSYSGAVGTTAQGIMARGAYDEEGTVRLGYIFLLFGSLGSFAGLPSLTVDMAKAKFGQGASTDNALGVVILLIVAYLWSEVRFYGQVGLLGLGIIMCLIAGFPKGLTVIYVVALMVIPTLTPFTTCEPFTTVPKVCCLMLLICLFYFVMQYINGGGEGTGATAGAEVPVGRRPLFEASPASNPAAGDSVPPPGAAASPPAARSASARSQPPADAHAGTTSGLATTGHTAHGDQPTQSMMACHSPDGRLSDRTPEAVAAEAAAAIMVCNADGVPIYASTHSWDKVGELNQGEQVMIQGAAVSVDGYSMVPIQQPQVGAVQLEYLQSA